MSHAPLHDDEIVTDEALVRRLLAAAAPDLADLPLAPLAATGSSNRLWRLGDDLLVRLPRQPGASGLRTEARWGPVLGAALATVGVAVPEVVVLGEPSAALDEPWSVVRWIQGERAAAGAGAVAAEDLAALVDALRRAPVPAAARDDEALRSYRAGPLADLADDGRALLAQCRALPGAVRRGLDDADLDALLAVWEAAVAADRAVRHRPSGWVHADLLAENLLVRDGRPVALLDVGDAALGDPTVDLVGAFELLDGPGRTRLRRLLDVDDATWLRAAGWSVLVLAMTLPYYGATLPARCDDRAVAARGVLADLG